MIHVGKIQNQALKAHIQTEGYVIYSVPDLVSIRVVKDWIQEKCNSTNHKLRGQNWEPIWVDSPISNCYTRYHLAWRTKMLCDLMQSSGSHSNLPYRNLKIAESILFGSRLDSCQRGGGIDILIFSKADPFQLSQQTSVRFFEKCEEKIDVTVMDPKKLTQEQQGFSKSDPKTADQVSETGQEVLVRTASQKTLDAIALVEAPLGQISVYDVGPYTPRKS